MTTITRFTKEQLIAKLQHRLTVAAKYPDVEEAELDAAIFQIALASLTAEPVAYLNAADIKNVEEHVLARRLRSHACTLPVYTAPPAPVVPEIDRQAICDKVYGKCSRIPGSTFYNAAEFALDEVDAAMLQGSQPVSNRDELREQVRREHAEWSDATFGNVGPVGPLKHLSKEALEAAANPEDPLEWADMQFLLWDAQRRAGISDGEITAAMEEKLKVNMARQWPEPKDGEPRLHIKTDQRQEHM